MNNNRTNDNVYWFIYGVCGLICFVVTVLLAKSGWLNWITFFLAAYPSLIGLSCFYLMFLDKKTQNRLFPYYEKLGYVYSYGIIFISILNVDDFSSSIKYFMGALIIIISNKYGWRYYLEQERIKEMREKNIEITPNNSKLSKYEDALTTIMIASYIITTLIHFVN